MMASQNIFISANQLPAVLHLKDVLKGALKSEIISRSCHRNFLPPLNPEQLSFIIELPLRSNSEMSDIS